MSGICPKNKHKNLCRTVDTGRTVDHYKWEIRSLLLTRYELCSLQRCAKFDKVFMGFFSQLTHNIVEASSEEQKPWNYLICIFWLQKETLHLEIGMGRGSLCKYLKFFKRYFIQIFMHIQNLSLTCIHVDNLNSFNGYIGATK